MSTCDTGCGKNMGQARVKYGPYTFPLYDEGDLFMPEIEDAEQEIHRTNDNSFAVWTAKGFTEVNFTINVLQHDPRYKAFFDAWACNNSMCHKLLAVYPCSGTRSWSRVRVINPGSEKISYDNSAIEIKLAGEITHCNTGNR